MCKVRDSDTSEKTLYKCKYYGQFFCKKHLEPKLVLSMKDALDKFNELKLEEVFEKEWRKEEGHPDFVYTKEFLEKLGGEKRRRT